MLIWELDYLISPERILVFDVVHRFKCSFLVTNVENTKGHVVVQDLGP